VAHFCKLDENNQVVSVVVVDNHNLVSSNGIEEESVGIQYVKKHVQDGTWVQTSYNGNKRRRYAGVGMTYSAEHDAFIVPQPYPSWTLDLDDPNDWVPPTPMPTDEGYWYEWNEEEQEWTAHEIEQPAE
jgi:hypothetical protein